MSVLKLKQVRKYLAKKIQKWKGGMIFLKVELSKSFWIFESLNLSFLCFIHTLEIFTLHADMYSFLNKQVGFSFILFHE